MVGTTGGFKGDNVPPLLDPAGYKGVQWQALRLCTSMEISTSLYHLQLTE